MGPLTIGFYEKNYIFPCREFKIHDSVTTVPLDVSYGALNLLVRPLDR